MKKLNFTTLFLGIVLIPFFSCQEEETPSRLQSDGIKMENGYLNFNDKSDFQAGISFLNSMTSSEFRNWEKENGFLSMEGEFYNLILSLEAKDRIPANFLENDIFYYDSASNNLMANISNNALLRVVNPSGLVKINGAIYSYGRESLKIISDGDPNKIDDLKCTPRTNSELGVLVSPVKTYSQKRVLNENNRVMDFEKNCTGDDDIDGDDKYRISLREEYTETYDSFYDGYDLYHSVSVIGVRLVKYGPFYLPIPIPSDELELQYYGEWDQGGWPNNTIVDQDALIISVDWEWFDVDDSLIPIEFYFGDYAGRGETSIDGIDYEAECSIYYYN